MEYRIALYCSVLYRIILYCILLSCFVLYWTVLHCIVLYCIVLSCFCMVLICIALYSIVFYCIVLYCIELFCMVLNCIALYSIAFYCIAGGVMAPIVFTFDWWGFLLADQFVSNHSIPMGDEKAWHPTQDHCFTSFNFSSYFPTPWLRGNRWLCSSNPWSVRVILSDKYCQEV